MADKAENEKLIQNKYMALKSLKKQIESAREQLDGVTGQIEQVGESLLNIKEISALSASTEILVPISNGVFMKAAVKDATKFIVNVGASAGIERDLSGVEEILKQQRLELSEVQSSITDDLVKMETEASELSDQLKELMN